MKTKLRTHKTPSGVSYDVLLFACPGCIAGGPKGYDGLHDLPVNVEVEIDRPSWNWNEDLEKPTLTPSILSHGNGIDYPRCHSFLTDGVFNFLDDSTHPLAGQSVPIPDLPDWAAELSEDDGEQDG